MRKFPNLNANDIYKFLLPDCEPIKNNIPNINWGRSWKNLNFRYINIYERDITFKLLHNIITTRSRLYQIKKIDSPLCQMCNSTENKTHMFLECIKVKSILKCFKYLLNKICNIKNTSDINILHLDFKAKKKQKNTAIILTTLYIGCVWQNRDLNKCIENKAFWTNILKHNHLLSWILKKKMTNIFTEQFCNIRKIILKVFCS